MFAPFATVASIVGRGVWSELAERELGFHSAEDVGGVVGFCYYPRLCIQPLFSASRRMIGYENSRRAQVISETHLATVSNPERSDAEIPSSAAIPGRILPGRKADASRKTSGCLLQRFAASSTERALWPIIFRLVRAIHLIGPCI